MNLEEKSRIMGLIFQISSDIRGRGSEDISFNLKELERFLHSFTIENDGTVKAIYSNEE